MTTSSPEVRFEPAGNVRGEQVLRYFLVSSAGTEVAILTFGGIIETVVRGDGAVGVRLEYLSPSGEMGFLGTT